MGLVGHTPTDLRPLPANPPYHKKCRMFLSTTKGRDSSHTVMSGTLLENRAESGVGGGRGQKKAGARRAPALYRSMAGGPRDLLPPLHHLTRHLGHACLCIGGTYFWGRHH
jgi:hypothetical protein